VCFGDSYDTLNYFIFHDHCFTLCKFLQFLLLLYHDLDAEITVYECLNIYHLLLVTTMFMIQVKKNINVYPETFCEQLSLPC